MNNFTFRKLLISTTQIYLNSFFLVTLWAWRETLKASYFLYNEQWLNLLAWNFINHRNETVSWCVNQSTTDSQWMLPSCWHPGRDTAQGTVEGQDKDLNCDWPSKTKARPSSEIHKGKCLSVEGKMGLSHSYPTLDSERAGSKIMIMGKKETNSPLGNWR